MCEDGIFLCCCPGLHRTRALPPVMAAGRGPAPSGRCGPAACCGPGWPRRCAAGASRGWPMARGCADGQMGRWADGLPPGGCRASGRRPAWPGAGADDGRGLVRLPQARGAGRPGFHPAVSSVIQQGPGNLLCAVRSMAHAGRCMHAMAGLLCGRDAGILAACSWAAQGKGLPACLANIGCAAFCFAPGGWMPLCGWPVIPKYFGQGQRKRLAQGWQAAGKTAGQ